MITPGNSSATKWKWAGVAALTLTLAASVACAQNEIVATVIDQHGKPVTDAVVVAVPTDGAMRLPTRRASMKQ